MQDRKYELEDESQGYTLSKGVENTRCIFAESFDTWLLFQKIFGHLWVVMSFVNILERK